MSSTTSSDFESCDCSQCTYSFENNHNDYGKLLLNSRHVPMYATMAHPLVYYAEIQPATAAACNKRQTNDQPRKDNPFKKAFKWYTQERKVYNKSDAAPERSGFANWLDNKYVEYLRESGQQTKAPTSFEPRAPKNSTDVTLCNCPGTTKKFGRIKSPWRKRRRSGNDSGDVSEKCTNASCEFLLKPKELKRAASEPSYHSPTSGGKSNSTVASSNMPCNMKCSRRSHSLSDVAREKSALKYSDTVSHAVQECPNFQEQASTKLATKSPLKEQNAVNKAGPCCKCLQEKVLKIEQVPTKQQDPSNQPKPLQEEVPKVPSKEQFPMNQPGPSGKCLQEEVPKVPSKAEYSSNQPKPLQEEVSKVPSKEQFPKNQPGPSCKCLQEEVPKVPSKTEYPSNQPKPLQEEVPKAPSKEQFSTNQVEPCCKFLQEKVPEIKTPLQEEVPKVPSKAQYPTNQLGLICKCYLEKVPKVVQVPSQSRAVEVSCQCPEEKVAPVHEETQYAPESERSTQNLGPCCCKTCNKLIPPPPVICIPVKVQSNKIPSPEMCLTIVAPALTEAPKKQKAKQLCVPCQSFGSKSKVNTQSQHQPELSACCKATAARLNNCHEVNQMFGAIPKRRQSCSTVGINDETGECCIVKEVAVPVVNKFSRCVTCASNEAAQTSDHSIRFEEPPCSCCQYPLFLKIISDK